MNKHSDDFTRGRMIGMLQAGLSLHAVAARIGVDRKTVRRWWRRYQLDGSHTRNAGSGRRRKTDNVADRQLCILAKRNRFVPCRLYHHYWRDSCEVQVSRRTVYRRLLQSHLRSYRPLQRIPLGPQHKLARRNWCNERLQWSEEWKNILFTDESRFSLDFNDGRLRVRRLPNERFNEQCIVEHDRFGRGSVMVWGGITWNGRTDLVRINGNLTSQRYVDEVLIPTVIPFIRRNQNTVLQQDNARPHSARNTVIALQDRGIEVLPWPARSPDLSPIEHIWDIMGRLVNDPDRYPIPAASFNILEARLRHEWTQIPQHDIQHLIESLPRRLQNCIGRRGGHTRY